jgi:2-aminoadipate transaminase
MEDIFASRMHSVHRSFIREILKVTEDPKIISFAGGLPSPDSFPVREIASATAQVLAKDGENALQYSTTEGYAPLREYVAKRYRKKGIHVDANNILIVNGSQQGIDLIGKVFLNKGDVVAVERPTYLAAIQSFGFYEPVFKDVPLLGDGPDVKMLETVLDNFHPKLLYTVPNFQNPTGITYSRKKREDVAKVMEGHDTVFVEDDPYGEIRFMGEDLPSMRHYLKGESVLLGSFSKIVSPGMRLGWICASPYVMEKLVVAKQASDLHSNYFTQRVVHQYLTDNDVDRHIRQIGVLYKKHRDLMVSMIEQHFPDSVKCTKPEGGMFLWVTLPEGVSSMNLFNLAIKENVAFVPGQAFYVDGSGTNTMRLNFSNSSEEQIEEGIKRLSVVIKEMISKKDALLTPPINR